jgi:shikimate dehydrogenase
MSLVSYFEVNVLESDLQEIVCCMGKPVAGNPSQVIMERAFAAANLDWRYLTFEIEPEDLGDAVRGIRVMRFQGASLTFPHKGAAVELVDELTDSARLMQAISCIRRDGDRLIGENTDGQAFVTALRECLELADKRVVLLGAGAAARAIAVELGQAGVAQITVVNRSADAGQRLVDLLKGTISVAAEAELWDGEYSVPEECDILINATPIGLLDPDARVPLDLATLQPTTLVADVIFNPPQTWLLREAADRGCTVLAGSSVLVQQAALDFKIWTGQEPDFVVMREAMEEFLEI